MVTVTDSVERADLERGVDADDAAGGDRDARLHVLLEALQRGAQRVGARRDVPDGVGAGLVAHAFELQAGVLVDERHGGAGHARAGVVGQRPGHAAVDRLRRGRGRQQTDRSRKGYGRSRSEDAHTNTRSRQPAGFVHSHPPLECRLTCAGTGPWRTVGRRLDVVGGNRREPPGALSSLTAR